MASSLAEQQMREVVRQIRSSRPMAGRYYLEKWFRVEEQKNFLPLCETKLVTPELVRFSTPFPSSLDDRAFVYVESLGLIRGVISRAMGPTSEMDIDMTLNERSRLASRILWADIQAGLRGTDLRRFPRYEPNHPDSSVRLPDGTIMNCRIANISATGAAIISDVRPPLSTQVILGQIHSEIRRHTEDGFAVEFLAVQDPSTLEDMIAPVAAPAGPDYLVLRNEEAQA